MYVMHVILAGSAFVAVVLAATYVGDRWLGISPELNMWFVTLVVVCAILAINKVNRRG